MGGLEIKAVFINTEVHIGLYNIWIYSVGWVISGNVNEAAF